jgi:osmotically-inducible protein OsmY
MGNYEKGGNRNREGFNRDWDDNNNRYRGGRKGDDAYDFGQRQSQRNPGNYEGNYGNDYNRRGGSFGEGGRSYGYNEERDRNYNDYRGNYGMVPDMNRGRDEYSGGGDYYSGRGYGRTDQGRDDDSYNDRGNSGRDRNWLDKTADEVSSWFGDDDAKRRRRMDELRGEHKGKGPKGYSRSDDRIRDDVNDKLSDDSYVDASEISVSVSSGEVTLTGMVNSRQEKRRAEDLAEEVSGVKNVENRIRVGSSQGANLGSANTGVVGTGGGTAGQYSNGAGSTTGVGGSDVKKR